MIQGAAVGSLFSYWGEVLLVVEKRAEEVGRSTILFLLRVSVEIKCHGCLGVPQAILYGLDINTVGDEQGRVSIVQLMELEATVVPEPYWSNDKDNYPKAVGLAKFADRHGEQFGRIQLIRKEKRPDRKEHFYRLDMNTITVRNIVCGSTSNAKLDRVFAEHAATEDGLPSSMRTY